MKRLLLAVALSMPIALSFGGPAFPSGFSKEMQKAVDEGKKMLDEMKKLKDEKKSAQKNVEAFERYEFEVFSAQDWARMRETHAPGVVVHWPDAHETTGLEKHLEELKELFVYAPDTAIKAHQVKFGADGFTAATGFLTGTFTKPMPLGGGKFAQPNLKSFSVPICTIGQWKGGVMTEKWLYWDERSYRRQLGLAD